jgi:hypothetical protein
VAVAEDCTRAQPAFEEEGYPVDVTVHSSSEGRWALPRCEVSPRPPKVEGSPALERASRRQDLRACPWVGAFVLAHVDEAIPCPAEVAGVVEAEAVEYTAAVPAVIRRLDAAVVGLPVAHPALQCHVCLRVPTRI